MAKSDPIAAKKERNKTIRWVVTIFFVTILISGTISVLSDEIMSSSGMAVAFLILFLHHSDRHYLRYYWRRGYISRRKTLSFHGSSKSTRRPGVYPSSAERRACQLYLQRRDASATIAAQILNNFEFTWPRIVSLVMSALVAGLTVGGKAIGKTFAIESCTAIVHTAGKFIFTMKHIPDIFRGKKQK